MGLACSIRWVLLVALATGCGGRYRARATAAPVAAPAVGPVLAVAAAALPFAIVDGRTGRAVTTDDFWRRLGEARAVCVGEEHPNPHHHWAQLTVVDHLAVAGSGRRLALGLEMVQRPYQGVLDDYASRAIDEAALLSRTGWADRWGYPFALYRPMLELARTRGLALIALNAPRELVKRVARAGVAALTAAERAQLPALVLDDVQHRAWFDGVMRRAGDDRDNPHHAAPAAGPHPGAPPADQVYAAQVVWDESMAEQAHAWLAGGGDAIVILAGTGHCHDSAIVRRLLRRGATAVVSVRPILDDGEGNVADALAEAHNDYLFVMTPPG